MNSKIAKYLRNLAGVGKKNSDTTATYVPVKGTARPRIINRLVMQEDGTTLVTALLGTTTETLQLAPFQERAVYVSTKRSYNQG